MKVTIPVTPLEDAFTRGVILGHPLSSFAKRLFDILASLLGMLVLSPFLGMVALNIRRESPGPVFYRGRRMGRGGREFHILKFRTMYERPGKPFRTPHHRAG